MADSLLEISQGKRCVTFECLQQLVCRNSCAECIWRIASRTRKLSFWPLLLGFLQNDCFVAPLLSLPLSFCLFFSPSPPTHCSKMSAGALIGQIDCKWSRGVWGNQSNIVKQFFGHEGISLACVELIRSHSAQRWLGS